MNWMRFPWKKLLRNHYGWLAVLIGVTGAIAALFVLSEHYFYFSDWGFYHGMAADVTDAMRQSPARAWTLISRSTRQVYNQLYTLPLLPGLLIFGESRLVYIVSLAIVYLVPLSLVLGAIATKVTPAHPRSVFWCTAFLTPLLPFSWGSIVRGYPDVSGALFVAIAALLYVNDIQLKRLRQAVLMGGALAIAVLLRRHFAYGAIALLGAIFIQGVIDFAGNVRRDPHPAWTNWFRYSTRIGLIVATILLTLVLISWKWVYTTLTTDYKTLYASYSVTTAAMAHYYTQYYGWAVWAMVGVGCLIGMTTRALNQPVIRFVALWGLLSLLEWLFLLRYLGDHYTLNLTPQIILALAAFIWSLQRCWQGATQALALGAICLFLAGNAVIGLTPVGSFSHALRPLFSATHLPAVRRDYDEIVRLVNYLRELTPNREAIVMATTISYLSPDLPYSAEQTLYGRRNRRLNILGIPTVDSSGWYPMGDLMQAQYVVVTKPFEHALRPDQEDIVKVVHTIFVQNWQIAQDFKRLPPQFTLESGTLVWVYQRVRPTSLPVAIQTFNQMQQQIGDRPGGQMDWLLLNQPVPSAGIEKDQEASDTYKLHAVPGDAVKEIPTTFLYIGSLASRTRVTSEVELNDPTRCQNTTLKLSLINRQGKVLDAAETRYSQSGALNADLSSQAHPAYLMLDVLHQGDPPSDRCKLKIRKLAVSAAQ